MRGLGTSEKGLMHEHVTLIYGWLATPLLESFIFIIVVVAMIRDYAPLDELGPRTIRTPTP